MKFIQYFTKEVYGYYEFEAKDKEEADEKMEKFYTYGEFEKQLHIRNDGWSMGDSQQGNKMFLNAKKMEEEIILHK